MAPLKGPGEAHAHDGSSLRIGIVHARWNMSIIEPLLAGAKAQLRAAGVKEENIVVQSVPGSWELPIAVQRLYSASQIQSLTSNTIGAPGTSSLLSTTDLLTPSGSGTDLTLPSQPALASGIDTSSSASSPLTTPFDALIAIGVLIKGETMHFEYISEAVSHGLMRVALDTQVPLIFGLLTVLTEEQALVRAGVLEGGGSSGHNHGEDWGRAAVELGVRRQEWGEGRIVA